MKEWNTRVLCDVTETSRDGDQNPAPPLRASGVLPANTGSVGGRTRLCFGRGGAGLLGSPLPTSGCRVRTSFWRPLPGRPADTILVPPASVSSQGKPHSPCARERSPWSPRGRPPGVHRAPAPGHANARAGPRSARLRVPQPRSCAAGTGPRPEPGAPSSRPGARVTAGRGGRPRRAWLWASCFTLRVHVDLGFCSPVTELYFFKIYCPPPAT